MFAQQYSKKKRSICFRHVSSMTNRRSTRDGDATDSSSWTCASGEACEITYDLQAAESLEQLRIGVKR